MASFVENPALLKEIREHYWTEWLETPLKDLPMDQVREKLALARHLLHEVEVAARCKDCDWQIEDRPEGIGLLLPEVQGFRNVAVVLAVRARYEIAQGKWDDAVRTLQTGYAVGRHLGPGADAHPRPRRRRRRPHHGRPAGDAHPAAGRARTSTGR